MMGVSFKSDRRRLRAAKLPARLVRNRRGIATLEFALVFPVYFMIVAATLEIGLGTWYSSGLDDGVNAVGNYLRDQAMQRTTPTPEGIRQATCDAIRADGLDCANLKIAIYSADNPVASPVVIPTIIDDRFPPLTARGYVIALGYEWKFTLPTTRLLLSNEGDRVQIQARSFASVAERVIR